MGIEKGILKRSQLLMGDDTMHRLASLRVIIFGVGGVGSWCAESLVRSGVGHLTIVDSDRVCITNINRQAMATTQTVGQVKVEVLKERLLSINPAADIVAVQRIFCEETASEFDFDTYDYVVDAIDSLKDKVLLIELACRSQARLFSSMGAALKMDPTKVQVAEFWKVQGCPLARALRQRFHKLKRKPARKFQCVFSEELLQNRGEGGSCGTELCACAKTRKEQEDAGLVPHDWSASKAQTNGSMMHITAIFGLTIAGLILNEVYRSATFGKST